MGRREDNKQKKRERLLREGLALFLEQGYDRASIEQIAAASDVARGTFYLYFQDKRDLFDTLVDAWFAPTMEALTDLGEQLDEAAGPLESLLLYQQLGARLAMLGVVHRDAVLLTFRENRHAGEAGESIRRREVRLQEAVTALTRQAAERGLITAPQPELVSLLILGAIERLYYEVLVGRPLGDPQALALEAVGLLARMLGLADAD